MRRHPLTDFLVRPEVPIREALGNIERGERKTAFVIDEDQRLIGVVTDGDIRRWLINGGDLTAAVGSVSNPDPITVRVGFDREVVRRRLEELGATCAPVVDDDGRVVDLVDYDDLLTDGELAAARTMLEVLASIRRAGADFILTYHAREAARLLRRA